MDRKLATIFASDVVGFSTMMGMDEVKTLKILKERRLVIDTIIDKHQGIIFGSAGDSVIAEFSSPIKAAEAAIATQLKMRTMNQDKLESDQMTFRVGINIGDVAKDAAFDPAYGHCPRARHLNPVRRAGRDQMIPQCQMISRLAIAVDFKTQLIGEPGPRDKQALPANVEIFRREIAHVLVDGPV